MLRVVKPLAVFASVGMMSMATLTSAQAELSCADLSETISDIDKISDGVFFENYVQSGSDVDDTLSDVITAAQVISDEEDDSGLDQITDRLEDAWVNKDWDAYSYSLDEMADRLAYFYDRDC